MDTLNRRPAYFPVTSSKFAGRPRDVSNVHIDGGPCTVIPTQVTEGGACCLCPTGQRTPTLSCILNQRNAPSPSNFNSNIYITFPTYVSVCLDHHQGVQTTFNSHP
jgi:hypothetical protein